MVKIWDRKSFKVAGHCGEEEKTIDHSEPTKVEHKKTKTKNNVVQMNLSILYVVCIKNRDKIYYYSPSRLTNG